MILKEPVSLLYNVQLIINKKVFVKHEKVPTAPPIRRGIDYLEYAHVLENHSFGAFSANFRWPKVLKGTSTHQNLSFEPVHMSWRPYVTKKRPGKAYISKNRCFRKFRPDSTNFR